MQEYLSTVVKVADAHSFALLDDAQHAAEEGIIMQDVISAQRSLDDEEEEEEDVVTQPDSLLNNSGFLPPRRPASVHTPRGTNGLVVSKSVKRLRAETRALAKEEANAAGAAAAREVFRNDDC